jgi:DNA-binding beta-propeller fold protein YncE
MGTEGLRLTALAAIAATALTGCDTVPFRSSGRPPTSVLGLGGSTPYVAVPQPVTVQVAAVAPPAPGSVPKQAASSSPDVYASTGPDMLTAAARRIPARLYVPHGRVVDVLDQKTLERVGRITTRSAVRQVVPSWDLGTLWISGAHSLIPLSAVTGHPGKPVKMSGPYTLHFTPDGLSALVVTGRTLEFRNPRTMALRSTLTLPCTANGSADFSAGGEFLVASCRYSRKAAGLVRVNWLSGKVTDTLKLPTDPQNIRLAPDGSVFYVADTDQVRIIDATRLSQVATVRTGAGTHALTPSRDGTAFYVTTRSTIATLAFATRSVTRTWPIPTGTDLGGVSADGSVLWMYGPKEVFALSPITGSPYRRVPMPATQLTVYPQPGRYSLGQAFR